MPSDDRRDPVLILIDLLERHEVVTPEQGQAMYDQVVTALEGPAASEFAGLPRSEPPPRRV